MRRLRSLRWQLLLLIELAILIGMGALGTVLSAAVRRMYLAHLEERLTAEARLIGEALAPAMASGPSGGSPDAEARRYAALLGAQVTLIGPGGTVWGESHEDRARTEDPLGYPEVQQALAAGRGTNVRFSPSVGSEMMYVAVAVEAEGRVVGIVRVGLPLREVQESVADLQRAAGLAVVFFAGLMGALVFLRLSPCMGAIRDLSDGLERLASGDLEAHVFPRTNDELGDLARAYNRMADWLRETMGSCGRSKRAWRASWSG